MPSVASVSSGQYVGKTATVKANSLDEGFILQQVPPCPEDLNEEGEVWWNYYCGMFVEGQFLSRMYLTSIHNLCILHMVRFDILQNLAVAQTSVVTTERECKGVTTYECKLSPLAESLGNLLIKMDKLLASLGMTAYTAKINDIDTNKGGVKGKTLPPSSSLPLPGA